MDLVKVLSEQQLKNDLPELKVGDMLEAIPVHICPTVNLQNQIYVADGGVLRTEIVAGRGKLQ